MSLIEFIGFVISFVAMIILFFKQAFDRRRQNKDPQLYEEIERRKEAGLREMLRALDVQHDDDFDEDDDEEEDEEYEHVHSPPRAAQNQKKSDSAAALKKPMRASLEHFQFRSKMEEYKSQTSLEKRQLRTQIEDHYANASGQNWEEKKHDNPYALKRKLESSRVHKILRELPSKQEMIILHEILGQPKAALEPFDNPARK